MGCFHPMIEECGGRIMFRNYQDVLSIKGLCQALRIGRNTAYKLIGDGTIKSIRVGNVHKITKKSLIEYIKNGN